MLRLGISYDEVYDGSVRDSGGRSLVISEGELLALLKLKRRNVIRASEGCTNET